MGVFTGLHRGGIGKRGGLYDENSPEERAAERIAQYAGGLAPKGLVGAAPTPLAEIVARKINNDAAKNVIIGPRDDGPAGYQPGLGPRVAYGFVEGYGYGVVVWNQDGTVHPGSFYS